MRYRSRIAVDEFASKIRHVNYGALGRGYFARIHTTVVVPIAQEGGASCEEDW